MMRRARCLPLPASTRPDRILAFVVVLAATGCSSSYKLPEPRKSVAAEDEETPPANIPTTAATTTETKPAQSDQATGKPVIAGVGRGLAAQQSPSGTTPRTANPRVAKNGAEEEPELPKRSDDLRQWKPDDFRAARAENDTRLLRAVSELAPRSVGDESIGRLLIELLEAPDKPGPADQSVFNVGSSQPTPIVDDEDGLSPGATPRRPDPRLAEACVAALGVNQSAAARKGLARALQGTLGTDLTDKKLVELAIKALVGNPHPKHEEMLLTVLTRAEQVRPAQIVDVGADYIQQECLKQVKNAATASFRRSVSEHVARQSAPGPLRDRLVTWLLANDPLNLAGQAVLYAGYSTDLATRRKLEQTFAPRAREALLEVLRLTGDKDLGRQQLSPQSTEIVEHVWSSAFARTVAERLHEITDIEVERDLIAFATQVPLPEVRREAALLLKRRWSLGAKQWEKSRVDAASFLDPGLLLAVKSLPREDAPAHKTPLGEKWQPPKLAASNNLEVQRFQAEKKIKEEWMLATERMVKALNERFRSISQGAVASKSIGAPATSVFGDCGQSSEPAEEASAAAAHDGDDGLPIEPHAEAHVINEFHLAWPRRWPSQLSTVDAPPLTVHYVRMEQEERLSALLTFYRRQLTRAESRYIERGNWVESVAHDRDAGTMRSVDVMITRPTDAPPIDRTSKEPLVVELLWVEAPDPTS